MNNNRNECHLQRAQLGKRFLAFLVDLAIGGLPLFLLSGIFLLFIISAMLYLQWRWIEDLLASATDAALYIWAFAAVISFFWLVAYTLLRDSFGQGRSWGKRLMGLQVINCETGLPCGVWESFTRNYFGLSLALFGIFLPLIGLILLLVEPLAIITQPEGRRVGDRWAGTCVVTQGKTQ